MKAEEDSNAAIVVGAYGDGGLVDAVHDVDLQGVQVWKDLAALRAGVFGNVVLVPVGTSSYETGIRSVWTCSRGSVAALHFIEGTPAHRV